MIFGHDTEEAERSREVERCSNPVVLATAAGDENRQVGQELEFGIIHREDATVADVLVIATESMTRSGLLWSADYLTMGSSWIE